MRSTSYFHNSIGGYIPAKFSIVEDLLNFQLRKQPIEFACAEYAEYEIFYCARSENQPVAQQNPNAAGPVLVCESDRI